MPKELDIDFHSAIDEQMEAADIVDALKSEYGITLTGNQYLDYANARKAIHELGAPINILEKCKKAIHANRFYENYSFENMITDGMRYRENLKAFGCTTWYDWCVSHWGTKWNAVRTGCEPYFDLVTFETAWDPPILVLIELSKQIPDTKIDLKFASEDLGHHSGHYKFLNGNMTGKIDTPESKKAYRRYSQCMEAIKWCLEYERQMAKTVSSES